MKNLTSIGKTIFLTTHFMDEAQYLANRVAVIATRPDRRGGHPGDPGGRDHMRTRVRFLVPEGQPAPPDLGRRERRADGSIEIRTENPTKVVHELTAWALNATSSSTCWRSPSRAWRTSTSSSTGGEEGTGVSAAVPRSARQFRFTNKAFWRNPASAFFTFAFPLMFLVIFTALLGQGQVEIRGFELDTTTYYVGAMAAFGVVSACFTNIAIQTTFNRDAGILKRLRGTPLPARRVHGGPRVSTRWSSARSWWRSRSCSGDSRTTRRSRAAVRSSSSW